jgi:high-affinity iron transporter
MNFSNILPTFFVTLREGFEAALVVGIVLACLKRARKTQLNRSVYLGIIVGIIASVLVGLCLGGILQGVANSDSVYAPVLQEVLAAGFGTVAIVMLSWMLLWMTRQAKFLKAEVEEVINSAIDRDTQANNAAKGVFLLIFIAVLREGFETVLFIAAQFQEGWQIPTIGAIAGLSLAAFLGFLLFELGIKINIRLFFQIMGIFLLLIVGGLVVGVLKHFDGAIFNLTRIDTNYANFCLANNSSCILGMQVWDASSFLPEKQFPGILLKTLFGYRQTLYLAQAVAYILFLAGVGGAYWRSIVGVKNNKSTIASN